MGGVSTKLRKVVEKLGGDSPLRGRAPPLQNDDDFAMGVAGF